jgi:flavorubredoxin
MTARKLIDGIYEVGAKDYDRRLFDELIPLPEGTSYNSYLIQGSEKTALIDTVDPSLQILLFENLKSLNIKKIDYLISNHAEQDHSGSIPYVLERFPEAKVVTNQKCMGMLKDHLHIADEKFIVINDHETLSLGNKNLEFIFAPWVHWPETMFTYLKEDKILFSCDFLASHLATDNIYATEDKFYDTAKRYFAKIMMPFTLLIKKHLETLKNYEINIIAPSHGPAYNQPKMILDAYADWVSDNFKNNVVIAYVSMHGSTKMMVDYVKNGLNKLGIDVTLFNLPKADLGEIAMSLVDSPTVIIGSPTLLVGPHPAALGAAVLVNALRPKIKFVSVIGSYGWKEGSVEAIKQSLPLLKAELLEPVTVKGMPKEEDFKQLDRLVNDIVQRHKSISLIK